MSILRPDEDPRDAIDRLLEERRPDRFVVSGDPDGAELHGEWLDEIAADIEAEMGGNDLRREGGENLRRKVRDRERVALRSVNTVLRGYERTGQFPLFDIQEPAVNGHLYNRPLSVETRTHHPRERAKTIIEHVAFRAVTADDLRKFADAERRRTQNDSVARYQACAGAEALADQMDEAGAVTFKEWCERPPEDEENGDD